MTAVQKVARLIAKPGKAAQLKDALQALESATREESGCIEFTFYQAISNESHFVLLEHFVDNVAFTTHLQLHHTQDFFKAQLVQSVNAWDVPTLGVVS